jgi:phosphate transport system substrate-binding protein
MNNRKPKILGTFTLIIMIVCSSFFGACSQKEAKGKKHTVTIAGSTSVMPFTEKLAEHFMVDHPDFVVNVQGGGSSAGIQACLLRTVDIGMSSRELKEGETALADTVICFDGIAIIVNPGNPLRNITLSQVKSIYNGQVKNWKDLGWIDRQIDAVTREEGSGTRGAFEELVMKKEEISPAIMVQDSNGSVKEVVATDPYAIGYISLGMVDEKIIALKVDGITPNLENIREKRYTIVRPFLFLTLGQPRPTVFTFIGYVLSEEGQEILRKEGLITKVYE